MPPRTKVGGFVRAYAEYVGGSKIRYHYPCGHFRTETLMTGPRGRRVPMSPEMTKWHAHYWRKENNGVAVPPCSTCAAKEA